MTTEISDRIAKYAAEHTVDCQGDRMRALREMADEPGEVALAVGCTTADVLSWIDDDEKTSDLR